MALSRHVHKALSGVVLSWSSFDRWQQQWLRAESWHRCFDNRRLDPVGCIWMNLIAILGVFGDANLVAFLLFELFNYASQLLAQEGFGPFY